MENLVVKAVPFMGSDLMAVKDEASGKIYDGVSYICNGIGMGKNFKDTEVKRIQKDFVLKRGCVKFDAGVFDPNNPTLAIENDFVPLWLAKISITPTMRREHPEVAERLIQYQLKAQKVLADAFIHKDNSYSLLSSTNEIMKKQLELDKSLSDRLKTVEMQNNTLSKSNALLAKQQRTLIKINWTLYRKYKSIMGTVAEQKQEPVETENSPIQNTDPNSTWRKDTNDKINEIMRLQHRWKGKVLKESYNVLQMNARCNLASRLTRLRKNRGFTRACNLDVIERDPVLRQQYDDILRVMLARVKHSDEPV